MGSSSTPALIFERILNHLAQSCSDDISRRDIFLSCCSKQDFIQLCCEKKRIVDSKIKNMGQGDSHDARAALCLEYVMRRYTDPLSGDGGVGRGFERLFNDDGLLPTMEDLSKAIGSKKNQLRDFKKKFDLYLNDAGSSRSSSMNVAHFSSSLAEMPSRKYFFNKQPSFSMKGGTRVLPKQKERSSGLIQQLAIKLGGMRDDCHDAAPRAENLFAQVKSHMFADKYRRDAVEYDLKQNQALYAVACFYLVVKKGGHEKNRKKNNNDADDNLVTRVQLIKAANVDKEKFNDVLRAVEKTVSQMKKQKECTNSPDKEKDAQHSQHYGASQSKKEHEERHLAEGGRKRQRMESYDSSSKKARMHEADTNSISNKSFLEGEGSSRSNNHFDAINNNISNKICANEPERNHATQEGIDSNHAQCSSDDHSYYASAEFDKWKEEVLRKHIVIGREMLSKHDECKNWTNRQALDQASDAVLQKHGLL